MKLCESLLFTRFRKWSVKPITWRPHSSSMRRPRSSMDQDHSYILINRTKQLPYSLKEFKKLGQITAPTSFLSRFLRNFILILWGWTVLLNDTSFNTRVMWLPMNLIFYSSDFWPEAKSFQYMLWVYGYFLPKEVTLSSEQISKFFHNESPTFENLRRGYPLCAAL